MRKIIAIMLCSVLVSGCLSPATVASLAGDNKTAAALTLAEAKRNENVAWRGLGWKDANEAFQSCVNGDGTGCVSVTWRVIRDYKRRWIIVERRGDKAEMCWQAGLIASAFLNASAETEYNEWKNKETETCRR